jgi:hypothetical protein
MDDFDQINTLLEEKYGEPEDQGENWSNDLYRDDPSEYGMALAVGHLTKYSQWLTHRTEVRQLVFGDKFEISHSLRYISRELADVVDKRARDEQKEAL